MAEVRAAAYSWLAVVISFSNGARASKKPPAERIFLSNY